jgi:hypothetical protein
MSTLLKYLKDRVKLSGDQYFSFDELTEWPVEQVKEAEQQGWLAQVDDADGIICLQCPEHCWKPVEVREKEGRKIGVIHCEHEDCAGLIEVELKRLRQWEIVKEKLCPKQNDTPKQTEIPLNVRVANSVIRHQKANSVEIAKMVDSTEGSVRTTESWKMRKRLRQRYDTEKGWKNSEGKMDAISSKEILPEHYDIYEMFQKYKSGTNREYPSIDCIAKKLEVTHAEANKLLKEAQSMLGFSADPMD